MIYRLLAVFIVCVGLSIGAFNYGLNVGVDRQKVSDQILFDNINQQLASNKEIANKMLQTAQNDIILLQQVRATENKKLQDEYEKNVKTTNDIRLKYVNDSLHFKSTKIADCGRSGSDSLSSTGTTTNNTSTTDYIIPRAITQSLQSIVYDADSLNADYTLLYNFVHKEN